MTKPPPPPSTPNFEPLPADGRRSTLTQLRLVDLNTRLKQQYYDDKRFHPSVIGCILLIFLCSVSLFISHMEGISYFDSFYASFITYSTIGFGDIDIFVSYFLKFLKWRCTIRLDSRQCCFHDFFNFRKSLIVPIGSIFSSMETLFTLPATWFYQLGWLLFSRNVESENSKF